MRVQIASRPSKQPRPSHSDVSLVCVCYLVAVSPKRWSFLVTEMEIT